MDEMIEGISGAIRVMDDILIAASSVKEHNETLRKVIQRATSYNLSINFDKCHIKQSSVPYVGHLITSDGLKADPTKIEAVKSSLSRSTVMPAATASVLSYYRTVIHLLSHLGH